MALLEIRGIHKDYYLGKSVIHALKDLNFTIDEGDFISIVGPSGCGKTTLLNILGCIDKPTSGKLFFNGQDLATLSDNQEAGIRLEKMGFIFQAFNLVPVLSCFENVEFPLILAGIPKQERKKRVEYLVELVGLEDFSAHRPDELSGGQRQRVAIARALVNNPSLVIADEPTANLDSATGNVILETMAELNQKERVTFIFSTHNPDIMHYAQTIIHLKDGRVTGIDAGGSA
ncbi:ABC transporter ATP-binding protein [Sediminispirochaeta bajacaliforniensis]|uniref:ABC transporter ATP-binding protein n=1 Tax=Sediminispirochaeta bajacaliforniensis TaxID=148 RepID=UPI00037463DF|nr:ABC transporter ATP-binding protein [Sediminispirochaeta bajacaliforniensis]